MATPSLKATNKNKPRNMTLASCAIFAPGKIRRTAERRENSLKTAKLIGHKRNMLRSDCR